MRQRPMPTEAARIGGGACRGAQGGEMARGARATARKGRSGDGRTCQRCRSADVRVERDAGEKRPSGELLKRREQNKTGSVQRAGRSQTTVGAQRNCESSPREGDRRAEVEDRPGAGCDAERHARPVDGRHVDHDKSRTIGRESPLQPGPQRDGLHPQRLPGRFHRSLNPPSTTPQTPYLRSFVVVISISLSLSFSLSVRL
nr:unnamed protein product [Callosobruchus chinensis]